MNGITGLPSTQIQGTGNSNTQPGTDKSVAKIAYHVTELQKEMDCVLKVRRDNNTEIARLREKCLVLEERANQECAKVSSLEDRLEKSQKMQRNLTSQLDSLQQALSMTTASSSSGIASNALSMDSNTRSKLTSNASEANPSQWVRTKQGIHSPLVGGSSNKTVSTDNSISVSGQTTFSNKGSQSQQPPLRQTSLATAGSLGASGGSGATTPLNFTAGSGFSGFASHGVPQNHHSVSTNGSNKSSSALSANMHQFSTPSFSRS